MINAQVLYDPPTGVWVAETSDGLSWVEVARGQAVSEAEGREAALNALGLSTVLEDAETWGRRLVRAVELDLLKGGINDDRVLALAVDRELDYISSKLKDGRLHIALAALEELLAKPESERLASDALLRPVEAAIKQRLDLEEAARR